MKRIYGIDYLKTLGVVAMIITHSKLFMSKITNYDFSLNELDYRTKIMLLIGFFALSLPATAGVVFRETLSKYFVGKKISNFPKRPFYWAFLSLFLIESFKNAFGMGVAQFFRWDVLHFVSLSFIIMLFFLERLNILYLVGFTIISCFALTPMKTLLHPLMLQSEEQTFSAILGISPIVYGVIFGVCGFLLLNVVRKKYFLINYKTSSLVYISIAGLTTAAVVYFGMKNSVMYTALIWNLPMAIFIGGQEMGGHIWPLFPWFAFISAGFLLHHFFLQAKDQKRFLLFSLAIFGTIFLLFFQHGFEHYFDRVNKASLFSSQLYSINIIVLSGLISFFGLVYALCQLYAFERECLGSFVYSISRGILIAYIAHYLLGLYLARPFVDMFQGSELIQLFPFVILFLTLVIVETFLALNGKKFNLKFLRA